MSHTFRLLLVIPHLGGGGAERVTAQLATHLDPAKYEIHLATICEDQPGAPPIPAWVTVHRLQRRRVRRGWYPLLSLVRRLQPDVVFSGMAHLSFLILALKQFLPRRTRIAVRQNTTASAAAHTPLARLAYRALYPFADSVFCQSQAMAIDLMQNFSLPRGRISVLANPVDIQAIRDATRAARNFGATPPPDAPCLLCVARLSPEKGIDLLLRAFAVVLRTHAAASLTVLGNGPLQSELQLLARNLGVDHAVSFRGHRTDLVKYYAQSTLFVLPSRCEGMPNALLEAAAAQLPIVATPASAGLCDLLRDAPGTWLTPSITAESLAETVLLALIRLKQESGRLKLFDHAFLAPFDTGQAIAAYARCFEKLALRSQA